MTVATVPRTQLVTPSSRSMAIIVCIMFVFQAQQPKSDSLIWRDWFITEGDVLKEKVADVLPGGPSDAHAKISTKTCPSSQPAIICMPETQQMSVTQGWGDKPKLQTLLPENLRNVLPPQAIQSQLLKARLYPCIWSGHRQQCVQSHSRGYFTGSCFELRLVCMMFLSGGLRLRKPISSNLKACAAGNSFQQGFWHQSSKKTQILNTHRLISERWTVCSFKDRNRHACLFEFEPKSTLTFFPLKLIRNCNGIHLLFN